MSSFKISPYLPSAIMVLLLIAIVILLSLTAIYVKYYRKLNSKKIKLYNELNENCVNKTYLRIIFEEINLVYKKGNISLKAIIYFSETKRKLLVIENFINEITNYIDYISSTPFCSTRKEIFKVTANIETIINGDNFSKKITSVNQFKILNEISNLLFEVEDCNNDKHTELFFKSNYLLAKIIYIELFE